MDLGEVIAFRCLRFTNSDREAVVKLGKPMQTPKEAEFYCPSQILGLGDGKVRALCGVDAFQALQLTIEFIGLELDRLSAIEGLVIRWESENSGSRIPPTRWACR